jgi:hypothetical protein
MSARARALGVVIGIALVAAVVLPAARVEAYAFLYVPSSQGVPRRWNLDALADGRVPWVISNNAGSNLTGDRAPLDVITAAFATWEDDAASKIQFAFRGTVGTRERNGGDGVNLIALGAKENLGTGVLAATFLSSDGAGVLLDVDIVFASSVAYSTSSTPDDATYDLQAIATHEIGHFLGLEHSALARATMVPYTDRGQIQQRSLHSDDEIGAALLYPVDGFLAGTGSLNGRITVAGAPVSLANVVAANVNGPIVASAYSRPDGSYQIDGLPPDVYVVYAEPLDGPVAPGNVGGFRAGFSGDPTTGYGTFFH